MRYSVTTPVGIDVPIKNLQTFLYDGLRSLWSLTEDQVLAYPRAYRQDGRILLYSTSYLDDDGFLQDSYALKFFFLDQDVRLYSTLFNVPVDVYFFVNLQTVKPSITWRADENVKQDVFNVIRGFGDFVSFGTIDLEGYNEKMDMQPWHSFKVTTNLIYRYDKTI